MREIYVKFKVDWEDYEDVSNELILEDMELELKDGVEIELLAVRGVDEDEDEKELKKLLKDVKEYV